MPIRLCVVEGPEAGRVFEFTEYETFMVGRGPEAHLRLSPEDRYCSRLHFMVELNPPLCRLWDMDSNNGTRVNGQRVEGQRDLKDGDTIKAGRTLLRVELVPEVRSEQTLDWEEVPTVAQVNAGGLLSLPGYRLEEELGKGGMGVVYRGVEEASGQPVAIKLIHPTLNADEKALRRFLREASTLRRLSHKRIVNYRSMGRSGDRLFVVMEYVAGRNLAKVLEERGPLSVPLAVGLACQILEGLAYAHEQGYVHRDIKPGNILLAQIGGKHAIKIADFGLARIYQASRLSGLTMEGEMGGTLRYAAPEQLTDFRTALPASDQYSTAVLLYQLLTGELPLPQVRYVRDLYEHTLHTPPTPLVQWRPEVPPALDAAVLKALAKRPEARHADALTFRAALRAATGV